MSTAAPQAGAAGAVVVPAIVPPESAGPGPGAADAAGGTPYKGPDSYQVEDAALFFGRDAEARQLVARILSRRLTLLHAPSGAGKTSLLNARVIPELEKRGWLPVRIIPTDDPLASIRTTTLRYLLPPLSAERQALTRAVRGLCGAVGSDPTLRELLAAYDALPVRDDRARELIAGIETPASHATPLFPAESVCVPYLCRLLRSSISIRLFAEHVAALGRCAPGGGPAPSIDVDTRVSALLALLADPGMQRGYAAMLAMLDLPAATLSDFFENLAEVYRPRAGFCVVLILDQFEELFTRFGDRPGMPSYRRRDETFAQLDHLYRSSLDGAPGDGALFDEPGSGAAPGLFLARTGGAGSTAQAGARGGSVIRLEGVWSAAGAATAAEGVAADPAPGAAVRFAARLPLRLVVSMRDEYLARVLDHVRMFAGVTGEPGYHLFLMSWKEAVAAIRQPAAAYGYNYHKRACRGIVAGLLREGRHVEPTALQIVCEKLWQVKGQELARHSDGPVDGTDATAIILPQTLEALGGVKGILASFFTEFVERRLTDPRERSEAFEMLESLVTGSRTRNIVERDQMVTQRFRDVRLRAELLDRMEKGKIVRVAQRLDGFFVEITHEFLIDPILRQIKAELVTGSRYRDALRTLLHFGDVNFRLHGQVLSRDHFLALDEYWAAARRKGGEVLLPAWAVELMFRTAIVRNVERDVLRRWADRFSGLPALDAAAVLDEVREEGGRRALGLDELWLLRGHEDHVARMPPQAAEQVLVSALSRCDDGERESVRAWTRAYQRAISDAPAPASPSPTPSF